MIVLVDMDDTMTDLLGAWCSWLNQTYGTHVSPKDVTDWEVYKFFPTLTQKQVFDVLSSEEFWKTVRPKEGAVECLKQILDDGDEVFIVTAANYDSIKFRFDFIIKRYFPFIKPQYFIMARNKQMVKGDILVDDGVHNLEGGEYDKILVSVPHNSNYDANSNGMQRAETWKDVYKIIQKIKHKRGLQ